MHLAQLKVYPVCPVGEHHYTQLINIKKVQDVSNTNRGLRATG